MATFGDVAENWPSSYKHRVKFLASAPSCRWPLRLTRKPSSPEHFGNKGSRCRHIRTRECSRKMCRNSTLLKRGASRHAAIENARNGAAPATAQFEYERR